MTTIFVVIIFAGVIVYSIHKGFVVKAGAAVKLSGATFTFEAGKENVSTSKTLVTEKGQEG